MKILAETLFGSHLYGLATESSDKDYKGVILPTSREILLGNCSYHVDKSTSNQNTKNISSDIDRSYYTLSYFINLALKGETVAIDMLHGDPSFLIHTSDVWEFVVENKHRFFTKSMKSYVGYCRKQAARYGVKGSRVGELEKIIGFLENQTGVVGELEFPDTEFGRWVDYKGNRYYEFAGSKFQDNLKIGYMLDTLNKIYGNYGERSKLAKENLGVDWKAISHGIRAGYQARDIFLKGGFEYPLKETNFLMDVKAGKLDFVTEVEPEFNRISAEVMLLSEVSEYPEVADRGFWDDFLVEVHLKEMNYGALN
jgi:hypothetical protein